MIILNLITAATRMLATYNRRLRISAELNAYSDRELTDLGIARSDISRIAHQAAQQPAG